MTRIRTVTFAFAIATLTVFGCFPSHDDGPGAVMHREILPSGTVVVSYESLPETADRVLSPDLRIGALEGDADLMFGDVRGIQADERGMIYVLDHLASDIRVFDPSGAFVRRIAHEGEGPGEITEANGMRLVGDTILWIQDHGKGQMLALRTDGTEAGRVPMPVLSYGYMWSGAVDDSGAFWKPAFYAQEDEQGYPPELGLRTSTSRLYFVRFRPATGQRDSIFLGVDGYRAYVARHGNGYSYSSVPFDAERASTVDPDGSIWTTDASEYRVVHIGPTGDTLLVLEAALPAPAVTRKDRTDFVDRMSETDPSSARIVQALADLMPDRKPTISGLLVDDTGTLWVRRGSTEADRPFYDRYSRSGEYRGGVVLSFTPSRYLPLTVRNGNVYALAPDELDVPYVVRAPMGG